MKHPKKSKENNKLNNNPNNQSNTSVFWEIETGKDDQKDTVIIDTEKMLRYLESNGYSKVFFNKSNTSILIRINNNIVKEVSNEQVEDFILDYVRGFPEDNPNDGLKSKLLNKLIEGSTKYFTKEKLTAFKPKKIDYHRDTKKKCYFYFSNRFVEISNVYIAHLGYNRLKGAIWKDQIINRPIEVEENKEAGEFAKVIYNICSGDKDRILALRTSMGYLLHRHKDKSLTKAIIYVDEEYNEEPEGRTGKSLVANAVGELRKVTKYDGKQVKFNTQFAFQNVEPYTNIIVFDDVKEKFPFENMFHMITDGIEVERKFKDRYTIPFEKSPKYLITSNYAVEGVGGSIEARKLEYEFSSHYSSDYSPRDEFNHNLFDDWNNEEWNLFFNYVFGCVQDYLKQGLLVPVYVNLDKRKIIQATSLEFYEFMVERFPTDRLVELGLLNKPHSKSKLLNEFCLAYPEYEEKRKTGGFTPHRFTGWLRQYAMYNNLVYDEIRLSKIRGHEREFILTKKPKKRK